MILRSEQHPPSEAWKIIDKQLSNNTRSKLPVSESTRRNTVISCKDLKLHNFDNSRHPCKCTRYLVSTTFRELPLHMCLGDYDFAESSNWLHEPDKFFSEFNGRWSGQENVRIFHGTKSSTPCLQKSIAGLCFVSHEYNLDPVSSRCMSTLPCLHSTIYIYTPAMGSSI